MNRAYTLFLRLGAPVLLCGILGGSSSGPIGGRTAKLAELGQIHKFAAGLTLTDWQSIRAQYEGNRYTAFPEPGGYRARNGRQQWLVHFDGRGFQVEPDGGGWKWGLELASYGYEGHERTVQRPEHVTIAKQRVSYQWYPALEEWLVNDQRGLEQGFTLRERPSGAGDWLKIRLAIRGGLHPRVEDSGRAVRFLDLEGRKIVDYAGLCARDANGRRLEASFREGVDWVDLVIDERGARYPLIIDPIAQQAYLKASNTGAGDLFGMSVAVSGDTVVVGAPFEDSNATGVNGDESNNAAPNSGAAYVFVRSGTIWSQQAYLKASNTRSQDQFGSSVAISGDTVVVGAPFEDSNATGVNGDQTNNSALESGAAYVFVRNGTTWSQQAYLKASNTGAGDLFGVSVAISVDTVVVGAHFEDSNATGVNGDQTNNSSPESGAAYVFVRMGTTWSQQAYVKASNTGPGDAFGVSVAISGDTVAVGALREDSSATGVNGDQSNNSVTDSGAAYVFVRMGTTWSQQAYLKASNTGANDQFGDAVAISVDTLVVGAAHEDSNATGVNGNQTNNSATASGAAYVFVRSGTNWSQQAYLKASNTGANDTFGTSVAISGDTVMVGAPSEDSNATGVNGDQKNNSAPDSGAAYVFARSGTSWTQQAYLKASNTGTGDLFGMSVAISGGTLVVGALYEDSNATSVNGDQTNNSAIDSGAADVFMLPLFRGTNSASYTGPLAPGMIAFGEAPGIASALLVATENPWPTILGEVRLSITDSRGQTHLAPIYYVSTSEMGFLVPADCALGPARATLTTARAAVEGTFNIESVSPGLYSAKATGSGVAAAFYLRVFSNGARAEFYVFDVNTKEPRPIDLGPPGDQVYLELFGTGFRGNTGPVTATVGGIGIPIAVLGVAAHPVYEGLDQVNIGPLPRSLAGSGTVSIEMTFGGKPANPVTVTIR